jgi:UDP:flavonoid glycosyltransferase YjiC (YdhE family)
VHVVEYVPFGRLLPTTDLVVGHAGAGTMLAALGAGRPMVLLPFAADQPQNAAACRDAGAALVIEREGWTGDRIRSTVEAALAMPSLAEAALRIRAEIQAMPGPAQVVTRLERMVASR